LLEDEALRRAYHGVEKPITVAGQRETIHEYSDTVFIFLLKGARPQEYRDNVRQEVTGADGVPLGPRKVEIVIVPTPLAAGMTGSQEMRLHPERGHRATFSRKIKSVSEYSRTSSRLPATVTGLSTPS
jgi:hypothetical protein